MMRGNGAIRMGMAFALLFVSLSLVVRRQSTALDELRALDAVRAERAAVQSERAALQREIQWLESRTRVVSDAGARLGLRVPTHTEIVILTFTAPQLATTEEEDDVAGIRVLSRADHR